VASAQRAATGTSENEKGARQGARGRSGVPLPPGARAGRNPIGDTDPVAARCALATGYHRSAPAGARKPQRQPAGFRKLSQWTNFNIHWLHFQIDFANDKWKISSVLLPEVGESALDGAVFAF